MKRFHFDASWLLVEDFVPLVSSKITSLLSSVPRSFGPLDDFCLYNLRKFLRGWGQNRVFDAHRNKNALLGQIDALDKLVDSVGLPQSGWDQRYSLEGTILELHR